jgi:phage gpG-like protein
MMSFTIDNKEAMRVMDNIKKGISDFKPALEQIKGYQIKEVDKQYKTEGTNILGGKWPAIKKSTERARIRAGFAPGPILTASGKMRRGTAEMKLTKNELQIGNDVQYFKFHQLGTKKGGKERMPRRQVFGHSNTMVKHVLDMCAKYIIKTAKAK